MVKRFSWLMIVVLFLTTISFQSFSAEAQAGPVCDGTLWQVAAGPQPEEDPCGVDGTWNASINDVWYYNVTWSEIGDELEQFGGSLWRQILPTPTATVTITATATPEPVLVLTEEQCASVMELIAVPAEVSIPEQDPCGLGTKWNASIWDTDYVGVYWVTLVEDENFEPHGGSLYRHGNQPTPTATTTATVVASPTATATAEPMLVLTDEQCASVMELILVPANVSIPIQDPCGPETKWNASIWDKNYVNVYWKELEKNPNFELYGGSLYRRETVTSPTPTATTTPGSTQRTIFIPLIQRAALAPTATPTPVATATPEPVFTVPAGYCQTGGELTVYPEYSIPTENPCGADARWDASIWGTSYTNDLWNEFSDNPDFEVHGGTVWLQ